MKKSIFNNLKKKMTSVVLAGTIFLAPVSSAFASSTDYTSYLRNGNNYYGTTISGTTTTISRLQGVADLVAQLMASNQQHLYNVASKISTLIGKIESLNSYVDGVESSLSNISGYVDGLESSLNINNNRLQSILTAIQDIDTYNYTSVLNSILANSNYLGSIESHLQVSNDALGTSDTGIWGAASGIAYNSGLISSDTSNIKSYLSSFTLPDFKFLYRNYISQNVNSQLPTISQNNFRFLYPEWGWVSSGVDSRIRYMFKGYTPDSIMSALGMINNVLNTGLLSSIYTPYSQYHRRTYDSNSDSVIDYNSGNDTLAHSYSLMDSLFFINNSLELYLGRLSYVFADSDTIAQKKANASKSNQVMNDFTGSNGASLNDFTGAKDSLNSVKNGINTGTNVSNILGIFDSSDGYNFFSQNVADDINGTASNSRSTLFKSNSSDSYSTPLLDEKMNSLYSVMGVGYGK